MAPVTRHPTPHPWPSRPVDGVDQPRTRPVFNERLPAPEALAADGQTIVNRDLVDAQQILESVGLSYLADRWLLTLGGRSEPISALIVEASSQRLLVRNVDFGYEGNIGMTFLLDVPVDGRVRR